MDPSIMKILEEDEDETMHSGADVEAFTAALNRDIEGDTSNSQPSDSDSAALSQGSNQTSGQMFPQWQTSSQDENANCQGLQYLKGSQQQEQHSSELVPKQHASGYENQQPQIDTSQERNCFPLQEKQSQKDCQQWQAEAEQNTLQSHSSQAMDMKNSEKNPVHVREPDRTQYPNSESQFSKLQKMSNQHPMAPEQAINPMNHGKQVPFALLLPVIQPQLDKDRAMQLQTLYIRLKKNEITKDVFVRHMRSLVGDQMLKMAVFKLQTQGARNSQPGSNQFPSHSQASVQQHHLQMQTSNGKQFPKPQSLAQLHQKGVPEDPSHIPSTAAQLKSVSNTASMGNNAQKSQEVEHQSVSHGMQVSQMSSSSLSTLNQEKERCTIPVQGLSKQQQQQLHFSHSSFPTYGNTGGNYPPFSGTNVNTSSATLNQQPPDFQMRQVLVNQSAGASQSMNVTSLPKVERQNSFSEPMRVQGGTPSHLINNSSLQQNSVHWQSSTSKEQKNGAPSSMTYVKQEPLDQLNEQQNKCQLSSPHPQGLSAFSSAHTEQGNAIPGTSTGEAFEMQSSRMGFSTSSSTAPSNSVSSSMTPQLDPNFLLSSRIVSSTSPIGPGSIGKAPTRKPYFGQKKPLEAVGSSPPPSSKKQKVSGPLLDQSIEQLNDVTAVSGVNLREEEEQLFSGSKEDSRVSEASRRAVQEEEDRLLLQKLPLQKKLAEIMVRCDVKRISNDVERCLSLCVEERMHGLISNLIRLSKQRVDIEKARHRTVITSDVRQQIMLMNQKAREEWEKKQAEAGKLQKLDEMQPEGTPGVDGDKEKEEGRAKSLKANKEDDEKMRTTAANVAARAAVGGDDMLSKWQLMAEQARQKREGGIDVPSGSQPCKDVSHNPSSTFGRNANQEAEKRGQSAAFGTSGSGRKFGRNQVAVPPQPVVARKISIKDVIAVLEREPQMSKSTLIYQLHEKMRADGVAE